MVLCKLHSFWTLLTLNVLQEYIGQLRTAPTLLFLLACPISPTMLDGGLCAVYSVVHTMLTNLHRWYYWLFSILLGCSLIIAFFLLPETRFQRSPMSTEGRVVYTDEFGTTHVLSDEEARERFGG